MVLHAFSRNFYSLRYQYWRGLNYLMQLHENRPTKRAREAGRESRARIRILFRKKRLSAPVRGYFL
ncbi:hypothetical protein F1J77_19680 [Salmonella enterica subsp. enterica]|nr:hypothetical protein [Salmonella enterica]ECR2652045.1 hypothetical protein [Salmonella enterica subsp. enterica]EDR5078291.1 hypothetical protein [Salmonella enterica]EEJ5821077.1 hypothetical protein [Salmonella enterica]